MKTNSHFMTCIFFFLSIQEAQQTVPWSRINLDCSLQAKLQKLSQGVLFHLTSYSQKVFHQYFLTWDVGKIWNSLVILWTCNILTETTEFVNNTFQNQSLGQTWPKTLDQILYLFKTLLRSGSRKEVEFSNCNIC